MATAAGKSTEDNTQEYEPEQPVGATATTVLDNPSETGKPRTEPEATSLVETAARDAITATDVVTKSAAVEKWPGWPGNCVFRLIVPVVKVGSIIGRKGDIIRKMAEETRARIRVLEGPASTPDRVVLISGKEEPEAPLSPAMDAALRVFRRVSGLLENEDEAKSVAFCSMRLLAASTQALSLIGKQGSLIKSIQEASGASIRVLSEEESPFYAAADERIVELQGEALKVLKALEAVLGHLRKFLVDHTVIPLFEKNYNTIVSQDRQVEAEKSSLRISNSQSAIETDIPLLARRASLLLERETRLEPRIQTSGNSLYVQDPSVSARLSPLLSRASAPVITQVAQTMQIPFSYAEDIIGIEGANISYIRRTSGATITVQESRHPDEIMVEIKGTSSQVQMAQQLIQEFINNHKEPVSSSYAGLDVDYRPSYAQLGYNKDSLLRSYGESETAYKPAYSQFGGSSYSSMSFSGQPYSTGGYRSSDVDYS